jgi:hypothetical protein
VIHLYLTGTGNRKSLCRCSMCLDFSHGSNSFAFSILIYHRLTVR